MSNNELLEVEIFPIPKHPLKLAHWARLPQLDYSLILAVYTFDCLITERVKKFLLSLNSNESNSLPLHALERFVL